VPTVPATPPAPDPRTVIAQPTFETAMRAKAKDTLAALTTLAVQATPIAFTVQNIPVSFSWGSNIAMFDINDGTYQLRMPLAWVTGKP
jgi:hypothetical protein